MSSNELRWILLIAGILILIAIYWLGRTEHARRRRRRKQEAHTEDEIEQVPLNTLSGQEEISPALGPFDGLQDVPAEEAAERIIARSPYDVKPTPEPGDKITRAQDREVRRPPTQGDKIVSLYVVASRSFVLRGEAIRRAAERAGLEYGEMQVYNRIVERNGKRHVLFSLASAVQPGTLDIDDSPGFTTPALALFMRLPGPLEGLKAFNVMLDCAQRLAVDLDCELRDEARSILSNQTIDHMRDEIQLFSLRTARVRHPAARHGQG
jgi:cell division protein ZipA